MQDSHLRRLHQLRDDRRTSLFPILRVSGFEPLHHMPEGVCAPGMGESFFEAVLGPVVHSTRATSASTSSSTTKIASMTMRSPASTITFAVSSSEVFTGSVQPITVSPSSFTRS